MLPPPPTILQPKAANINDLLFSSQRLEIKNPNR
ncbi:MAG: hypothetical protein ACJAVI_005341 [Candidatus Azotimanducaceae bacterium]|jgi:hypothetical protein